MVDLVVAILRVTFFVCVILYQILLIPAIPGIIYTKFWKEYKIPTICLLIATVIMIPYAIAIDFFLWDILTGEHHISAIWEIK